MFGESRHVAFDERHPGHRVTVAICLLQIQPARHTQEMVNRNRVAWVGRIAPPWHGRGTLDGEPSFANENTDKCIDDGFCYGPTMVGGIGAVAVRVTFRQDAPVAHHHNCSRPTNRGLVSFLECPIQRRPKSLVRGFSHAGSVTEGPAISSSTGAAVCCITPALAASDSRVPSSPGSTMHPSPSRYIATLLNRPKIVAVTSRRMVSTSYRSAEPIFSIPVIGFNVSA